MISQGRYKMAYDGLKKYLASDPQDAHAIRLLGLCALNLKKLDEAEVHLKDAIAIEPWNGSNQYLMANLHTLKNQFPLALKSMEEALEFDPYNSNYHEMKARILLSLKKFKEAEISAREALKIDGQNVDAANVLSQALSAQSKNDEASDVMDKVLEINPENWETHSNYGYRYLEQGKVPEAIEHFRNALVNDPTQEYAQHGMKLAMKAKFPLYRWLLQLQLFMSKQGQGANLALIFGIIIAMRVLRSMNESVNGPIQYLIMAVIAALVAFVFSSWILDPIMTFVLSTQKDGKLALNEAENKMAKFVGINLALLGVSIIAALVTTNIMWLHIFGIGFFGLMVSNNLFEGSTKKVMNIAKFFYMGVAMMLALGLVFSLMGELDSMFTSIGLLGAVAYTWVGNGVFRR